MERAVQLGDLSNPIEVSRLQAMLQDLYRKTSATQVFTKIPNGVISGKAGDHGTYTVGTTTYFAVNVDGKTQWKSTVMS